MPLTQKQIDAGVRAMMERGRLKGADLAVLFGCSPQSIRDYKNDGIIEPDRAASPLVYPVWDSVTRVVCHFRDIATGRSQPDDIRQLAAKKLRADIEIKEAQAKKKKRELAVLNGKLVRADDVTAAVSELGILTRSLLMALPGKVAGAAAIADSKREAAAIIEKEARQILTELSRFDIEEFWQKRHAYEEAEEGNEE